MLLGQDVPLLGQIVQRDLGSASLCLSAGGDSDSPSFAFKGNKENNPNEDAALILRDGQRWLFSVADGHFGHAVSHHLIETIANHCQAIPTRLGQLSLFLSSEQLIAEAPGGSTLLVACLDEATGSTFGLSFGDCSLLTIGQNGVTVRNKLSDAFVYCDGQPLPLELAQSFQFTLGPQEILMLYTDGVNECCYRDPQRSVQMSHIEALGREAGGSCSRLARAVAELALTGVNGHPGGQDNIAILAYRLPEK